MPRYAYTALSNTGKPVTGALDAQSIDHANELIAAQGLAVVDMDLESLRTGVRRVGRRLTRMQSVHAEELILFTKQLSTMLRAGIPVLRVFDILESQTENVRLKDICAQIAADIRGGSNIYRAMKRHPDVFSPLYCSMVLAGETSGALPQILQRLIYVITHEYKVKTEVRSVLQYPVIVLIALSVAFLTLMTLVIPRFAAVYMRADLALPWPTRACLTMSHWIREEWLITAVGLLVIMAAIRLALRTETGRYTWDRFIMGVPLIGPLLLKAALSRFASIFSILQASGVGILDSLNLLSDTIGNKAIGREIMGVQNELESGRGIARPLMSARYFTPMFVNMVAIGEESGNLDEMLREISLHYDAEVEYATRRLTTAMGPILIVALAGMVGFFALAVYLPMWDLARLVTAS